MFLDIIHRPVYFQEHNVSETGFCLRLQVKPTQLGPIDRASPYLRTQIVGLVHNRHDTQNKITARSFRTCM
jgi:hypothetical protein